jgi:hypothetical protein
MTADRDRLTLPASDGPENLADFVEYWADKLFDWSLDLYKDHRLLRDFEFLRPEIEKEMPQVGGVALRLSIGMRPAPNNKYLPEYLGLQILGPALSSDDAEAKYRLKTKTTSGTLLGGGLQNYRYRRTHHRPGYKQSEHTVVAGGPSPICGTESKQLQR